MYREITLATADGQIKEFPFMANATTAIRFRQVFQKELLGSITAIVTSAGADQLARLLATAQAAEAAGKTEIDLGEMDPEMVGVMIKIVGSGELDTISQMAYIMHEQAAGADMNRLSMTSYIDWLEQFDTMEFLTHAMDFIALYMSQKAGTSTPKKETAQPIER